MLFDVQNLLEIALISDLHIGAEAKKYFGIDTRQNVELVLEQAMGSKPDLLILCGDQALDVGERPAYEWLKELLSSMKIPVLQISGNHDSSPVLADVFGLTEQLRNNKLYYSRSMKGFPLLFLDSSSGKVSSQQLRWLREEAARQSREALLFVHHPPTLCNARFMDENWPLRNINEVQETLLKIPNIRHIFSGHYHTNKKIEWEGREIHLCPATQMQISEELEEFHVTNYNPGWMSVRWDGKNLETKTNFIQLTPL